MLKKWAFRMDFLRNIKKGAPYGRLTANEAIKYIVNVYFYDKSRV